VSCIWQDLPKVRIIQGQCVGCLKKKEMLEKFLEGGGSGLVTTSVAIDSISSFQVVGQFS
jgi:hypothetical protein